LSDAAHRAGPARQRAVAVWLPRAAPTPWLKATVGTARRASRQPASLAPPASRQRRAAPDRLACATRLPTAGLARTAIAPTASPTASSLGPSSCRPDRLARRSPVAIASRCRLRAGEPPFPAVSCAPALCRRRLTEQRHRRAAPSPCSAGGSRLNFIIFDLSNSLQIQKFV
jgi:hypothetical protein